MQPPKLEKMVTAKETVWEVTYAGMTRRFKRDYEATAFYYHLRECYVLHLAQRKYQ
jgi:hypothetical protein